MENLNKHNDIHILIIFGYKTKAHTHHMKSWKQNNVEQKQKNRFDHQDENPPKWTNLGCTCKHILRHLTSPRHVCKHIWARLAYS